MDAMIIPSCCCVLCTALWLLPICSGNSEAYRMRYFFTRSSTSRNLISAVRRPPTVTKVLVIFGVPLALPEAFIAEEAGQPLGDLLHLAPIAPRERHLKRLALDGRHADVPQHPVDDVLHDGAGDPLFLVKIEILNETLEARAGQDALRHRLQAFLEPRRRGDGHDRAWHAGRHHLNQAEDRYGVGQFPGDRGRACRNHRPRHKTSQARLRKILKDILWAKHLTGKHWLSLQRSRAAS